METHKQLLHYYPVCWHVWPAQGGPIEEAGICCPLGTDMGWSNTTEQCDALKLDWPSTVIKFRSGIPYRPQFDMVRIRWKMDQFALFGPIHWQTTSREAWITQTVFAQLPGSHAHSNIGIYYSALLKECWHKHTEAKTWSLCNTFCSNTTYPSPHHTTMGGT